MLMTISEIIDKKQNQKILRMKQDIIDIHMSLYQYLCLDCGTNYANKCRLGSVFAHSILSDKYPEYNFILNGGWDKQHKDFEDYIDMNNLPGGMLGNDFNYHGHYWVESQEYGFIIDFTASQFGYSEVFITDNNDECYISNLDKDRIYSEIKFMNMVPVNPYGVDKRTFEERGPEVCFDITLNRLMRVYQSNPCNNKELQFIKNQWTNIFHKLECSHNRDFVLG